MKKSRMVKFLGVGLSLMLGGYKAQASVTVATCHDVVCEELGGGYDGQVCERETEFPSAVMTANSDGTYEIKSLVEIAASGRLRRKDSGYENYGTSEIVFENPKVRVVFYPPRDDSGKLKDTGVMNSQYFAAIIGSKTRIINCVANSNFPPFVPRNN